MDATIAVLLAVAVVVAALVGAALAGRRAGDGAVQPPGQADRPLVSPSLAAVLDVLRSSTILLDRRDDVVRASPAAYAFGLVRGESLSSPELLKLARDVRRDGETRQVDLELPRGPLGRERLAVTARVARLEDGVVLLLVEDRTEARRVDAVRRDFVANVSHELKTPVGALILLAEAVQGASDDPEAVRRFSARMQVEATRLSQLVQELLDLSRLQSHDPLAQARRVDLDDVVIEAVDLCHTAADAKKIQLVTGGEAGLHVLGDAPQLVMAVRNLVDNAVSYSPEGTRVAVTTRRCDSLVELTVTDQGIGIPERDLERIFERFYRVDQARSRSTGGTGLGLSIVKHVANNHGGDVRVWSEEGSGSTFTIRLPCGMDETGDVIGTSGDARAGSAAPGPSSAAASASTAPAPREAP
ncbi:sensor histidine kinase [Motilibacter deserti]|uniref:Sensor-like histidine kinase SenX3 n=1 Tax=Motilibacter deserti TaxID=2714956 RepID=A0ABX0GWQ6_9ACTN|nr:two-component sensor histidine kinase [Motilibacter deserti]